METTIDPEVRKRAMAIVAKRFSARLIDIVRKAKEKRLKRKMLEAKGSEASKEGKEEE